MQSLDPKDIEFGGPATYRIVVRGELDPQWSDRMAGLRVVSTDRGRGVWRTTLTGSIHDQAELKGVLDTLYGLHLAILQVETIENEKGRES